MAGLKLIVGLGNPGPEYERTRHNVGAVWARYLAGRYHIELKAETKFKGWVGRGVIEGHDLRLLVPSTYMNLSGEAVGALCHFYKISVAEVLVAYDEMAFEPGIVRLKRGGGDNGHNGIKSVRASLGNDSDFYRLRIGVGHPGDKSRVTAYLTQVKMPQAEADTINRATELNASIMAHIVQGEWQLAMTELHSLEGN